MTIADHMPIFPNMEYEEICKEVFIYRSFLSKEEVEEVMQEVHSLDQAKDQSGDFQVKSLRKYEDRFAKSLWGDGFYFRDFTTVVKNSGNLMMIHNDVNGYMNEMVDTMMIEEDSDKEYVRESMPCYGFIIYLTDDYEGGEIFYPEYSIEIKPKAGDLIIHNSEVLHAVRKVHSGYRFTSPNTVEYKFKLDAEKYSKFVHPMEKMGLGQELSEEKARELMMNNALFYNHVGHDIIYSSRVKEFIEKNPNYKQEEFYF